MSDTREQALERLADDMARVAPSSPIIEDFSRRLDAILALPADAAGLPWVSVRERLPDEESDGYPDGGGYVLVSDGTKRALVLAMHNPWRLGWTHWLPLSAIPLPDGEGK